MESGPPPPDRPDDAGAAPPPPPGPEAQPGYGGPVPPGGWEQPIAQPAGAWVGYPLAGWWSRVGAALIDGIIISIPASILFFVLIAGAVGITGDDSDASVWA